MGVVDALSQTLVHKDTLSPTSFITAATPAEMIDDADNSYFTMVHHRAATVGKVSVAGAQPYLVQASTSDKKNYFDVIVAHNGTLSAGFKLIDGTKRFASDSEWLAHRISQHLDDDGRPDFDAILAGVHGAWSLVVTVAGVTYMLNNGQRPMNVAWSKDDTAVLFASEADMLWWLAGRNNIDLKDSQIHQLEPHKVYSFDFMAQRNKVLVDSTECIHTGVSTGYSVGQSYPSYKAPATNPALPPPAPAATYTSRSAGVDAIYARISGNRNVIDVVSEEVTPSVTNVVSLQQPPHSLPDAVAELVGKRVEFLFNDVDANMGIAFGTYWLTDEVDIRDLSSQSRKVLSDSAFMMSLPDDYIVDPDATYTAVSKAIRSISETISGKKVSVPHLELDFKTMRRETTFAKQVATS